MTKRDLSARLRDVLPVAAGLAADGLDSGVALFLRVEKELAALDSQESAVERARRIAKKCHMAKKG